MADETIGRLHTGDPEFLTKAATEPSMLDYVRNLVGDFAEGAYSWPFDFTLCLHWIAGTAGIYGPTVKRNCDYHTGRIITVLRYSTQAAHYLIFKGLLFDIARDERARLALKEAIARFSTEGAANSFMDILPTLAHKAGNVAGRYVSGAAFSGWMETRGRVNRVPTRAARWGIYGFNTIALMWGSAINVSAKNPRAFDIVSLFVAWLTGDPTARLTDGQYRELFQIAMTVGQQVVNTSGSQVDLRAFSGAIETIRHFGEQGGSTQ